MAFSGFGRFGSGSGYGDERTYSRNNPEENGIPFGSLGPPQSSPRGSATGLENFQFRPSLSKPSEGLVPTQVVDSKLRKALDPEVKVPKEKKKSRPSSPLSALLPFRKKSKEVSQGEDVPSAFSNAAEGAPPPPSGPRGFGPLSLIPQPTAPTMSDSGFYGANMRPPLEGEYRPPYYGSGADSGSPPGKESKKSKKHRHKHGKQSNTTVPMDPSSQRMNDPWMGLPQEGMGEGRYPQGTYGFGENRNMYDGAGGGGGQFSGGYSYGGPAMMDSRWHGGSGFDENRIASAYPLSHDRWHPNSSQFQSPSHGQHEMYAHAMGRQGNVYGAGPYDDDAQPRVDAASAFGRSFGGPDVPQAMDSYHGFRDGGRSLSTGEPSQASTRAGDDVHIDMEGRQTDTHASPTGAEVRGILNTPRGRGTGAKGMPSGNKTVMSTPPRVRAYVPSQDTTPRTAENITAAAASGLGGGRPWSVVVPPAGSPSGNRKHDNDNMRSNSTPRQHHHQHWRTDTNESINLLETTNNEFDRSRTPRSNSAPLSGQDRAFGRGNTTDGTRTPQRAPRSGMASSSLPPSSPVFTVPTDAPAAERLLYKMLRQAPVQREGATPRRPPAAPPGKRSAQTVRFAGNHDVAQSPYSRRTRSPLGRTSSAPTLGDGQLNTSAVSSENPSTISQPMVQHIPRNYQQLVVTVLRDKDREILSLRCSLALAYRYCAYAIHRRSGRMAPSSPNSLSMMESRFLAAAANSIMDTETDNPLLLVDRAPPHIQGLPSVPLPLGITYSIGQVSGILSMLNVDDMFQKKKPTRIFLRSWKPRFVVADDRGIMVFRNEEDFKQHAYQRALVVAPYYDLEYFVPSFRQMASIEGDDLLDFTDDFRQKRTSTSQDANAGDKKGSRKTAKRTEGKSTKSKKGIHGLFSRHRSQSENASESDERDSVDSDESAAQSDSRSRTKQKKRGSKNDNDDGEVDTDDGDEHDISVGSGTRLRRSRSAADYDIEHDLEKRSKRRRAQDYWRATKDLHAELMARIALQYASDSQFTYFGFIAKQPSSTLDDRKPSNPPLIFRTDSWQQHTEWVHFLAQCFNKKLYRQMFPNALVETRIGLEDKEVQTDIQGSWPDPEGDGEAGEDGEGVDDRMERDGIEEDLHDDGESVDDGSGEFNAPQNEKGVQTELTSMWDTKTGAGNTGLSLLSNIGEDADQMGQSPPPPPPPPGMGVPKSGALQGVAQDGGSPTRNEAPKDISAEHGETSDIDAADSDSAAAQVTGGISHKAWNDVVRELRELLEVKNEEIENLKESLSRWQSHSTLLDRHVHELQDEKRAAVQQVEQMQEVMEMREEEVLRLRGTLDATNDREMLMLANPNTAASDGQSGAIRSDEMERASQQATAKLEEAEENAKRHKIEEEVHVLRGAVHELARENEILKAELSAVRDGYAEGLKSLARQALTDIDTLHGAYTTNRYADAIIETHRQRGYHDHQSKNADGIRGRSTPRAATQGRGAALRSEHPASDMIAVEDHERSEGNIEIDGSGQRTPKMLPPPTSLHPHSIFTGSASPIRSPSSKLILHPSGYLKANSLLDTRDDNIPVRIPISAETQSGASLVNDRSFAMLLLSYAANEIIDGCLTVDEEEARLLSSGPLRTKLGRQWEILHHDTAALFRVSVSLISGTDDSDGDAERGHDRDNEVHRPHQQEQQTHYRDSNDALPAHSHRRRRVTLPTRSQQQTTQHTRGPHQVSSQADPPRNPSPQSSEANHGKTGSRNINHDNAAMMAPQRGPPRTNADRNSPSITSSIHTPQKTQHSGGGKQYMRPFDSVLQDTFCGHEKRRSPATSRALGSASKAIHTTRTNSSGGNPPRRNSNRSTPTGIGSITAPPLQQQQQQPAVVPPVGESVVHALQSPYSVCTDARQHELRPKHSTSTVHNPIVPDIHSSSSQHSKDITSTNRQTTSPEPFSGGGQSDISAPLRLNRTASATMRRS